jgi:hypothetical protein
MENLNELIGETLHNCHVLKTINLHVEFTLAAAMDITLSEEEIKFLEEPYKPQPIIGH